MRNARHHRAQRIRAMYDKSVKDHVILRRHIQDESHASFVIGRPGESHYQSEIVVLSWGHLLVHGDVDAVIFGRCSYKGWRQVLGWMSGDNYDYAEEKASIGSTCSEMARSVDSDVAESDIVYWRRQKYIDQETARQALDLVKGGDTHLAQTLIYEKTGDFELSIATCTNCRVFMAQALITKLCELLDAEDDWRADTIKKEVSA